MSEQHRRKWKQPLARHREHERSGRRWDRDPRRRMEKRSAQRTFLNDSDPSSLASCRLMIRTLGRTRNLFPSMSFSRASFVSSLALLIERRATGPSWENSFNSGTRQYEDHSLRHSRVKTHLWELVENEYILALGTLDGHGLSHVCYLQENYIKIPNIRAKPTSLVPSFRFTYPKRVTLDALRAARRKRSLGS